MTYMQLTVAHLATIVPAFAIGTYLLVRRKGTAHHRQLGRIYMGLMAVTAIITLFMPAEVGSRFLDHFGWIHILSIVTFVTVPTAFYAARHHKVEMHKWNMISLYIGGLLIAGGFALAPGRLLNGWLFGTG